MREKQYFSVETHSLGSNLGFLNHNSSFMTAIFPSSDAYLQQDCASCYSVQIVSHWFLELAVLQWSPQTQDLNKVEHLWDVVK